MEQKQIIRRAFTIEYNAILKVIHLNLSFSSSFRNSNAQKTKCVAILDTGATSSAISSEVAKKCNLVPFSKTEVHTAGGVVAQNVYLVDILLPNDVIIESVPVTEIPNIHGADALLGMDIMQLGDLAITHEENKTFLSFQIPSEKKVDFVKEINKRNTKIIEMQKKNQERILKQKGNERCPCGSGRKYRYCCGKITQNNK